MKFDLAANPFVFLKLSPTAGVREVSDAIQDAIDDGVLSEDEAARVRQVLTTPKLRLEAELSSLLDVDRKLAQQIQNQLGRDHHAEDLVPFIERLHSLPRSNLLAHLNSKFGGDHTTLRQLFDAQEACAAGAITEAMNESREQSSLPVVTRPAVEAGLRALFARQLQGAIDGFGSPGRMADEISILTSAVVQNAPVPPERLDILLTIFGQSIEAELSRLGERVQAAIDAIRNGSMTEQAYSQLTEAIGNWLRLTTPLQKLEASKGRDDPRTRQMYETVNGLGIWLTNEKGDNVGALRVLRIAQDAFCALPRAVEQIDANIQVVEGNVLWSRIEPLMKYVSTLTDDARALDADLSRGGFGAQSIGVAKQLFTLFEQAEKASRGTEAHAQPWVAVRGLAIDLTNEFDLPGASHKLLTGLRAYAGKNPAPPALIEQLNADWMTTSDNVAFAAITGHIKAGRLKEAQAASEAAISATQSDDNRVNFTALRETVRKRRSSKTVRTFGWIAATIFVVWLIASNKSNHPPRRTTSTPAYSTHATPPVTREEYVESIPAVNTGGGTFSRTNIRYCRYQDARIEAARVEASTDSEIDRFNELVNSYNSRCGNFRYRQSDWDAISGELRSKSIQLASEGRALLR
ncbi:hypothetical protein [Jiella pelagia]|uniref:Uncharacterized protein n=1 Tax=Jiella pelagia TaxID=2986949 RepID=A0ABY7C1U7_9HYPH|nr:hypothetical protein [Jiella pelagia]WAP70057.1 hypothetical protein OH818_07900 [Jiella pelagia]